MKSKIPFVDLNAQYKKIKFEIDEAIQDVVDNSLFVRGKYVEEFESQFASKIGVEHCVSCGNGTDALYIALRALEVGRGDEIIVPAHSWISTSEVVTQAGGRVIFCDTDSSNFTIDPAKIEEKITSKTVGIIPVHLFGQAADMDPIMDVAKRRGLWVLEDCAQAHLAKYKGRMVGTFGIASTFSFYPGKNLGAMGDAGAVVTNDSILAQKMAMFARHGGLTKGDHQIEGINSRMDGLQAAILLVKLKYIEDWTMKREAVARLYAQYLQRTEGLVAPSTRLGCEHVWHLYVIKTLQRDELAAYLNLNGIQTGINYKVALPFLPAYQRLGHKPEDFPNAYSNQQKILSLPMYPELSNDNVEFITNVIKEFFLENKI